MRGAVKWLNTTKGYGFIRPESGDHDVFVHVSALERAGFTTLQEGQLIEFELMTSRGKQSAEQLQLLSEPDINEATMLAEEIVDQDTTVASKDLVTEVAKWKLEAKSEDNDRYFFHVREVSAIEEKSVT